MKCKCLLFFLLLCVVGMTKAFAYDFSAVCSTGQTLYYNITDATNRYVELTYPGTSSTAAWNGYTKPTGNITLPSSVTYNGTTYSVKAIGDYAFSSCNNLSGSLTIPNSVTTIGNFAFYACLGFTGSLTIPNSVTTISNNAFYNCSGFTGSLTIPNSVTTLGNRSFGGCSGFTGSLTIPNSVTKIGISTFFGCSGFTGTLTIPNSVTTIDMQAFYECSGFTGSLTIPNSVTTIGSLAFYGCSGFSGVLTIPNSVTVIPSSAFYGCSGFSSMIVLPVTPPLLGQTTFYNVPTSIPVYVPCGSLADYQAAEGWSDFTNIQRLDNNCDLLTYSINDDGVSVTVTGHVDGTAATGPLNIPETTTIDGITYIVTAIGDSAFYGCSGLTGSLTIPNSVTTISSWAFCVCSGLTGSLTIPNSVTTIGNYAFRDCYGFRGSLTIGNSVTTIGDYAFYYCTGFTGSLTLGNSVTEIGRNAFSGCSSFTGSLTIGNSVTTIADYAFNGCSGLTGSLTIPNSVTALGYDVFEGCSGFTGSLTIGNSVTTIGNNAFSGCSGFTGSLTIPNSVTTIGSSAFSGCSGFTGSLTIPNSVTTIRPYAFNGCSGFTSITAYPETPLSLSQNYSPFQGVPKSIPVYVPCGSLADYQAANGWSDFTNIQRIDNDCVLLYSINDDGVSVTVTGHVDGTAATGSLIIPETTTIDGVTYSVTAIGNDAFYHCSGFTGDLTIGNSVTTIGEWAFYGCSGFTGDLTIGNSVTTIGNRAFYACYSFTGSLTIPNSVTTIGNNAFSGCSGFTGSLTIGNSVTIIGDDAFTNCYGFTGSLTIPNSVTTISNNAFYGCSGFTGSLTIPNSVTTLGNRSFGGCSGFTGSLTIPNSVTKIGSQAFSNCGGFTGTLTIPNSVTYIGSHAFNGCSGFTGSLTLGNSVTTIGTGVFRNCTGITSITSYPETPPSLGTDVFQNVPTDIPVYVPCGSLADYQAAEVWSDFTNIQRIDNDCLLLYSINDDGVSVTVTGHVDGTAATGSLTIPETTTIDGITYSVTAIGNNAFDNCRYFRGALTIPNSVTSIGQRAFQNCVGFNGSLTIPDSVTTIGQEAFRSCVGFTGSLTIGNSVTTIGNSAFWGCTGFRGSLNLGSSLTTIGSQAFYYCNGFTGSLSIPDSVTTIGNDAFNSCSGFTGTLTIGNSVTNINTRAFKDCNNLTAMMVLPEMPPTLGSTVFQNVPTDIPVYVPCGSLADYQAASGWNVFTNMQCIPETLTVYDGTATNFHIPAYIYYFDDFTRSQFVIPAADLVEMTGTSISSMTFYTDGDNVPYTTVSSADVYLKEVTYTTISVYQLKASATTVYSGYFDIVSTNDGGEMTIHFSTPYTYNGGNLLIGIENTEDNGYKGIRFRGQIVSGASISGSNSSSTGTIPASQESFIPKTTFTYIPSECSSPKDLTTTDITSNSATLQWTGYQDNYDLRYRKKPFFFEDFENEPEGWTTIDNDGDGYNWFHGFNYYSYSGTNVMKSESWYDTALTPDNWLITPQLDLQGTMKVWLSANYQAYQDEHFAIYLSTTGNNVSDFTTVLVPETVTTGQFVAYTADLNAYAGQQGYIAIRHFNCTDMDRILLDDFGIFEDSDADEWTTVSEIESGYTLSALASATEYEWQVQGRDCDGEGASTEWSRVHSFATSMCDDMCTITITLTDAYSDGGGQIEVVDVATNDVLGTYTNNGASSTYTLDVCDGRELSFVYTSTDNWPYENGWLITDVNEGVITEHEGCRSSSACDAPTDGVIATYSVNCAPITCSKPTGLEVSAVTTTSVTLGWIENGDATAWQIMLNDDEENLYAANSNPFTVEGLTAATAYTAKVRAYCSTDDQSVWSTSVSFVTGCEVVVSATQSFSEGFEGITFAPACWEIISTGSYSWGRATTQHHTGSASAYSSYYGDNYLVMPDIQLSTDAAEYQLTFWSYNTFVSDFVEGNNTVVLLDGENETVLWSAETVSQEWGETAVDLSAYKGQTVSIAFKYAGNDGNIWYLDDVKVEAIPTFTLEITGYGSEDNGNWHLIAPPVDNVDPATIEGMVSGDFDLYAFDQTNIDAEWINFKDSTFNLSRGTGYLYAHGTDITLTFTGMHYTATESVEVPLVYDATDSHKCWKLVGNPFPCEAILNREYYVMDDNGTDINPVAVSASTPIPPCTAVFVKATAAGQTVVFTKVVP